MSRKSIPLLCYWGGRISHGSQGITYEDATPKAIKVNRGVKHSELIDKIYELIGIDSEQYKLKIICRYLANGQYVALTIDNDESLDIMLDMTKEKGINCVELYIEKSAAAGDEGKESMTTTDPSLYIELLVRGQDGNDVFFRIKRETPLRKLTTAYCERRQIPKKDFSFLFSGRRLEEELTPNEYHMEDGAKIYTMLHQTGD